ncbi:DNA-binding protein [Enterobacter sichuanensis]
MDLLNWAIRMCGKTESWLRKLAAEEQPSLTVPYDTLAPKTINNDSMQEYFSALKYAFGQNDVRNIAVTGHYGAGKSTVVSSYLKYHCTEKYINVSLAGFEMTEKENIVGPADQDVELSILQQILFKENRALLPDSRIDRIQNKDRLHTFRTYGALLRVGIPVACFAGLLFYGPLSEFLNLPANWKLFVDKHYFWKAGLLTAIAFLALYFITDCATKIGIFDKKIKLSKIAFLSGDVEVNEKEASSLLNNCLDEIVYFFARLEYKVVVFEDLDRLGTPDIFVKLREINKIINNNIKDGTPVRFIYAVRDDLFSGADARTKFFDFILPVISFMDSRNSFTLLKNKMAFEATEDKNLRILSMYLSDMRSLQNIVNEYHIFKNVVDNTKHNIRLLSVVFYKNIYAVDYNLSDKKTGVLYSFLRDYRTRNLHAHYFDDQEANLESLNNELERWNEHNDISKSHIIRTLLDRFVPDLLGENYQFYHYRNYSYYPVDKDSLINNESEFITFLNQDNVYVSVSSVYTEITAKVKQELLDEYTERSEHLSQRREAAYRTLCENIISIKERLRTKNAVSLSELIILIGRETFGKIADAYLDNISEHDYVTEQQVNSLRSDMRNGGLDALYALLSNDLVRQDYMSYRSIFHPGSMTVNDNDFVKAVGQNINCEKSNSEHYIDDEHKVFQELIDQSLIYNEGALHNQLLTSLLDSGNEHLGVMISALFQRPDETIQTTFVTLYKKFETPKTFEQFIAHALTRTGYLDRAISVFTRNLESEHSKDISAIIVSNVATESANDVNIYRNFIGILGTSIFRMLTEDLAEGYMKHVLQAEFVFDELYSPALPVELYCMKYIAANNLYKITPENVAIAITCLLEDTKADLADAANRPWSCARKHNIQNVIHYLEKNIDYFIKKVFIFSEEDPLTIREMLGKSTVSNTCRIVIIEKMQFTLPELSGIMSDSEFNDNKNGLSFHDLFFKHDRVEASWAPLLNYIGEDCNREVLRDWICSHAAELDCFDTESCDAESYDALYEKVICDDVLDDDTYETIIGTVDISPEQISKGLSFKNFRRLISMEKISLEETPYINAKRMYPSSDENTVTAYLLWFSQYKSEFFASPDFYLRKDKDEDFFIRCITQLMSGNLFSDQEKSHLVIHFTDFYRGLEVSDLKLSRGVALLAFKGSDNSELQTALLVCLITEGFRNRPQIAQFCHTIDEKELSSVFINSSQATITANDRQRVNLILQSAQQAQMIRSFEERGDGKIEVAIRRDKENGALTA